MSDEKIDENKVYTKRELLNLYRSKKLLIVDKEYSYTDKEPNASGNFTELHVTSDGYGLPCWYEQPVSLAILKIDPKYRKMMFDVYSKYAKESKELAKKIKEILPELMRKEKERMEEKNEKFLAEANKNYSTDIKKAKAEYDRVVKNAQKVLEEKERKVEKEQKDMKKAVDVIETYIK